MLNKIYFIIGIFYIFFFQPFITKKVDIQTSKEFLNYFTSNNNDDSLTLIIKNNINIDSSNQIRISNNISKLKIEGKTKDETFLDFSNIKEGVLFTNSIIEIEFSNINISGHIFFDNNKNVTFINSNYNGSIEYLTEEEKYGSFILKEFSYKALANNNLNCISVTNGNMTIDHSYLYGHKSCTNRLVNYNGGYQNKVEINESLISGENTNSLFNIDKAYVVSTNSLFTNFLSFNQPGLV